MQISYTFRYFTSNLLWYHLYKAAKCQYSPQKLTLPLNRLIKKGYSYDTVVRSLKITFLAFILIPF